MTHVIFEEDGTIKAGTLRSESEASAQIEAAGGRRLKVKSSHLLHRFEGGDPSAVLNAAQALQGSIDLQLLWETAPAELELGFLDLAHDYFGREASAEQIVATLLALHAAPIYFQKRGKGRFRKAPEEQLQAALAGIERRKQEAARIEAWVEGLLQGEAPPEIASQWARLLFAPDKNQAPWKALAAAAERARTAPARLLAHAGVIPSTYALHYQRFLLATFPKGTAFPDEVLVEVPQPPQDLPQAEVSAFSIDDASTTEIDDAFSLVEHEDGGCTVGVHIACPALGIAPDSALDRVARDRLSTVYLPGQKITMLPDAVVAAYSLDAGQVRPALSLYARFDAEGQLLGCEHRPERVKIAANLRLHELDAIDWSQPPAAADAKLAQGFGPALLRLAQLARGLAERRGETGNNRVDYSFAIDGDPESENARVRIWNRPRGSPLDLLVSEFMILANHQWGRLLAGSKWPAMYRQQAAGRTRMASVAGAHEGLKLEVYLWATSPLRRFSDLVNQRQILAHLAGQAPVYPPGDARLLGAIADFDATYNSYADFQQQMEYYWCLRYLLQEGIEKVVATTIRENLVRFDHLPIVTRVNDMPYQEPGTQVMLAIAEIDLWEPILHLRFVQLIPQAVETTS